MPTIEDFDDIRFDNNFLHPDGPSSSSLVPYVSGKYQFYYYFLTDRSELTATNGYDIYDPTTDDPNGGDIAANQSVEYKMFSGSGTNATQQGLFEFAMGVHSTPTNYLSGGYQYSVLFTDVVSNLNFSDENVTTQAAITAETADINIGLLAYDNDGDGVGDRPSVAAFANGGGVDDLNSGFFLPGYDYSEDYGIDAHGDVWLNTEYYLGWSNASAGGEQLATIIHELGHSLGLSHPDPLSDIDNIQYTIMSYEYLAGMARETVDDNTDSVMPSGLQMYDIVALQDIFETRNYTRNSSATTYKEGQGFATNVSTPFIYTIWDGGGIDMIDASGYADKVRIDLRQGEFSSIGKALSASGAGGAEYAGVRGNGLVDNNVGIAFYTVIENAKGTAGDDYLVGNAWNNTLEGGAGVDRLFGDGFVYDGRVGFRGDVTGEEDAYANQRAQGNEWEQSAADTSGNDVLNPGTGADYAYGGKGNDTIIASANAAGTALESDYYHGGGYEALATDLGDEIAYEDDGLDTVDFRSIGFALNIVMDSSGQGHAHKRGETSEPYNQLRSIESFMLTDHSDAAQLGGITGGTIDGGGSLDTIDYSGAGAGIAMYSSPYGGAMVTGSAKVVVNGQNPDTDPYDSITSFENVVGTSYVDFTYGVTGDTWTLDPITIDLGAGQDVYAYSLFQGTPEDWQALHGGHVKITDTDLGTIKIFDDVFDNVAVAFDTVGSDFELSFLTAPPGFPGGVQLVVRFDHSDALSGEGINRVWIDGYLFDTANLISWSWNNTVSYDVAWLANSRGFIEEGTATDDTLNGGTGGDSLIGGAGNDVFVANHANDVVQENPDEGTDLVNASVSYTLAANVENLTLTGSGSINATGNSAVNILTGNTGNNTLDGASGADTMEGGDGNDAYFADDAGDIVTENEAEGTDIVHAGVSWALGNHFENLTLTGSGNTNATGNSLDNVITGNSGNNSLDGAGGNDTLDGGAGTDSLVGGTGDDTYIVDANDSIEEDADEGTDLVQSGVSWTLGANFENLTLTGTGDVNATGNSAANSLTGNSGNNILDGGAGADAMQGGQGNDTYVVDDAGDSVTESASQGTDAVLSGVTYTLGTNLENLTLTGTGNIDATGNSVVNTLTGNSGNNALDGAAGADRMIGGDGDDTYTVDNAGDVVVEDASEGTDLVLSSVTHALSDNVENLTFTGASNVHATGNSLVNTLTGNSGANTLDGGVGADKMIGGTGNDTYVVDDAGDIFIENAAEGTDTVIIGFSYTLEENFEHLTLSGTSNINATGNAGNNTLIGNSGNNTLDGGAGNDNMRGGAGNDVYIVDSTSDTVVENSDEGTDLVLSSVTETISDVDVENLTLTGTANINGTGNASVNTITGNTGNNTLSGLGGADSLIGGEGNDTYVVDNAGDEITENENEGTDLVQSSVSYTLSSHVENLTLTGSSAIDGTGNSLDNSITGNTGVNTLSGGLGNDTLNGGTNADKLIGGEGDDTYVVDNAGDEVAEDEDEGTDLVQSSVTYTLSAHVENLTLTGSSVINATGNGLANTLTGNTGANTLDGGAGADSMIGGGGNDVYTVDDAGDVVTETLNQGIDTVHATLNYTLADHVENLTLIGSSNIHAVGNTLANILTGNEGDNSLTGDTGNDTLDGGAGADVMIGGQGNDLYVVDDAGDVITENAAEGTDTVQVGFSYTLDNADNVENLTLTGSSNINATGNELNNALTGNSGNNTLDGGAGNDAMSGGAGDDIYIVDNTSDTVTENASSGTDLVLASATFAISDADVENLTLTGSANINGTGNTAVNTITGNTGNNVLSGGTNADTLIGGLGDDTYVVDNAGDVVTEEEDEGTDTVQSSISYTLGSHLENLTLTSSAAVGTGNAFDNAITGNTSANTLSGADGNDILDGGSGIDTLSGGNGNDSLTGGSGADVMAGGDGDDVYFVDNAGDVINESADEGTDTVHSTVTHTLAENVENLALGTGTIHGTGNALANTITGGTGANTLTGGDGNDRLIGGSGNDTYVLNTGDSGDVVVENEGEGTDTVQTYISYTLTDNVEKLVMLGSDNLNGTGNALNNSLTGNDGNNTLDGGAGNDVLIGGAGDDTYIVDSATDSITENASAGTDLVQASATYTISDVDVENLTLTGTSNINGTGNASANALTGNSGNNSLSGMNGDDILDGGAGTDTLTGGANADTFVFNVASYGSVDTVTDFNTGQNDKLDIRDLLDGFEPGTHDITDWARITDNGGNSVVEVDRDGTGGSYGWTQIATLNGVTGLTDEAALVSSGHLLVA